MTTELTGYPVAAGVDAGIAWHYGDPLREQRLLTEAVAVIDRGNRAVLTVTGPDRLGWLHSICSQHVSDLVDGQSVEALVLSPNGHVEQHWQLSELGGTVWIDTEPGQGPTVLAYLEKMRFLKQVQPDDVSAAWAVISVIGPKAAELLRATALPTPDQGWAQPLPGDGFVRATARALGGFDLVVARQQHHQVMETLRAAGAAPAGIWAYEALRVAAREPRFGFETDHRTIAHEVGWIGRAVHLHKGCYRGQETVARVQNLGRPPRRLVLLHLSGHDDELPEAGTAVILAGRSIGFVGTAVQHFELGPIALAVIKRSVGDDAELTVAGDAVAVAPEA